jgi:hypothetical protein
MRKGAAVIWKLPGSTLQRAWIIFQVTLEER